MSKKLTPQEKIALLKEKTNQFSKFGLVFTDVFSEKTRKRYSYEVNGNAYKNTINEIQWMLGIWGSKRKTFVAERDDVCRDWRNNPDLLRISVEIGMLSPEMADKIRKGGKLTIEEAELIQEKVKSKMIVPPAEKSDDINGFSPDDKEFNEGELKHVTTNRYERNREAREKCIAQKGCRCAVCGIDFKETYGEIGEGFIHVHHVTPISSKGKDYKLDIDNDLVPVCPNCHAMMHRKNPPFMVAELREILTLKK